MKRFFSIALIFLVFLSSCSQADKMPENPTESPSTPTLAPTATDIPPTPTPTQTPSPTPMAVPLVYPGFQDKAYTRVCISVDIDEPDGSIESESIVAALQDLVSVMGMSVEAEGNCEFTLEVTGAMSGRSGNYEDCGRLYTGADFRGNLIMKIPPESADVITVSLSGTQPVEEFVFVNDLSECDLLRDEAKAPFSDIWQKPILEGLVKIYGAYALSSAFNVAYLSNAAVEIIEEFFEDENSKSEDVLIVLQTLIKSNDEGHIRFALWQLLNRPDLASQALTEIIPILSHQNGDLAALAAKNLMYIGPNAKGAIPALLTSIGSSNTELGSYSALAFGEIGNPDPAVLEALVNHLEDDENLMEACQSSLQKLTGKNFDSPEEWKAWWAACSITESCVSPIVTTPTVKPILVPFIFFGEEFFTPKVCMKSSAAFGTEDLSGEIDLLSGQLLQALGMEIMQSEFECDTMYAFNLDVNALTCSSAELSPGARLDMMLPTTDHTLETVPLRNSIALSVSDTDCLTTQDILSVLIYEGFKEFYGEPVLSAAQGIKVLQEALDRVGIK